VVQELPPISAMRALFRRTSLRVAVHRNDTVACFSTSQTALRCLQATPGHRLQQRTTQSDWLRALKLEGCIQMRLSNSLRAANEKSKRLGSRPRVGLAVLLAELAGLELSVDVDVENASVIHDCIPAACVETSTKAPTSISSPTWNRHG
jgi:hypothetical protein